MGTERKGSSICFQKAMAIHSLFHYCWGWGLGAVLNTTPSIPEAGRRHSDTHHVHRVLVDFPAPDV